MASRGVDLLITYRVVKLLVTPFDKQEAFKHGIIDKTGKVLKPFRTLQKTSEKQSYTMLHRFVFNLKRILGKVGLGGRLGSFAVALGLLIRENKELKSNQQLIESAVIKYLKKEKLYEELLQEEGDIIGLGDNADKTGVSTLLYVPVNDQPINRCFGIDLYEVDGKLLEEKEYAKYKV
jgi:hypothetical protein